MSDSFTEPASVAQDIIRTLFSTLDRPAYWLLGLVYELFFNVASADLFSNDTIMKFYGRVQVILGVFMMFELAMTVLKGIVNPDTFVAKDKGMSNLITRIATSLILITVLMPISIPSPKNEYEIQINNNGLLFGTLYSLQHRILANNTLGRLVLGTNDENTFVASQGSEDTELKKSARIFTSTILKGFYRINLVPEDQRDTTYLREGKDPATYNANRVCKDIDNEVLAAYTRIDADPGEIISLVNATCDSDVKPGFLNSLWTGIQKLTGTTKYVFAYMPVVSTIVAVVFVFILLSFTIDVAVRAVKLAVLRLIAPIPIIAYMDPKGGKDSAFNSWIKTLSSTYLDIFIRLAVVYFVIFLIQDMIINGIVIDVGTGVLGVVSHIVIWIGLFIFAKQAPKFIKQVLGMKDEGGKLFGGFGELAGIAGVGAGVAAGVVTGWRGSRASQEANWNNESHAPGETFSPNRGRQLASALLSGALSGGAAGKAAMGAKDHFGKAALSAAFKRNNAYAAAAEDGATLGGKASAYFQRAFTGETTADRLERQQKNHESASKVLASIADRGDSKAKTSNWTTGTSTWNGKTVTGNYQAWTYAKQAAESSGATSFTFNGQSYTLEEANALDYKLMTTNSADYIKKRGVNPNDGSIDTVLAETIRDYESRYGIGSFDANVSRLRGDGARKYFKDESDHRANQASEAKRELGVAKANSDATKP